MSALRTYLAMTCTVFGGTMFGCAIFGCAVSGCTVERPSVDDRPFPCTADGDCLDGYACVDRSMLGLPGFCAPACDPSRSTATCPLGLCTPEGACLTLCAPELDGTVRVDCPSGLTCVRTDLFRDQGVCWDIQGCSVGSECGAEEVPSACLSELLGIPALVSGLPLASNRLYCLATPQGPLRDRCSAGTIPIPGRGDYPGACLPTCNEDDATCPPSMSCWNDLGWIFGAAQQSVCWVGTWGSLCESDQECLFGRCYDVGDGRRLCTERCDEVPVGAGGCEGLAEASFYVPGRSEWTCRWVGADEFCVPRGGIGAPCGAGRPSHESLRCFLFQNESTGVCSEGCEIDADCYLDTIPEPRRHEVYCAEDNQICWPQGGGAASCSSGRECLSGRCVGGLCTAPRDP